MRLELHVALEPQFADHGSSLKPLAQTCEKKQNRESLRSSCGNIQYLRIIDEFENRDNKGNEDTTGGNLGSRAAWF